LIAKLKSHNFYQLISSTLIFVIVLSNSFELLGDKANQQTFKVEITNSKVNGGLKTLKTVQDDTIDIFWKSDKALSLHLHGYDIPINLIPGQPKKTTFKASITGRFPISIHKHQKDYGSHHNILYLEVYPR